VQGQMPVRSPSRHTVGMRVQLRFWMGGEYAWESRSVQKTLAPRFV
jgi:hypothetical protein